VLRLSRRELSFLADFLHAVSEQIQAASFDACAPTKARPGPFAWWWVVSKLLSASVDNGSSERHTRG
jgi:hypothetical protein